jgi:hypothetical protein
MTQQVTVAPPGRSPARWLAGEPAALPLPALPSSAAASRRHVRRLLHGWQLAGCLDTALLLASELVANAVTATGAMARTGFPAAWAPIELSLRRTGTSLIIEVRDPNPDPPADQEPSSLDEDGRGLLIVDVLSSRWATTQRTAAQGGVVRDRRATRGCPGDLGRRAPGPGWGPAQALTARLLIASRFALPACLTRAAESPPLAGSDTP